MWADAYGGADGFPAVGSGCLDDDEWSRFAEWRYPELSGEDECRVAGRCDVEGERGRDGLVHGDRGLGARGLRGLTGDDAYEA
jgi:hypothetical protein